MEIVIVMILTSIVMGLGYNGYLMIQKNILQSQKDQTELNDIVKFKGILDASFDQSKEITWVEQTQQLVFDNQHTLTFKDTLMLYSKNPIDTIKISIKILEIRELNSSQGGRLVSELSCTFNALQSEFIVRKDYSKFQIQGLEWN